LPMDRVEKILLTAQEIRARVLELGKEISNDYRGRDLVIVGILKGAVVFLSDLLRNIHIPMALDIMCVETYHSKRPLSEGSRILYGGGGGYTGKDVLVVEDIIDTGLTLRYIIEKLRACSPNTLEICTLLQKNIPENNNINVKYFGFSIPQVFVVGYGMDYRGRYRNLPDIRIYSQEGEAGSLTSRGEIKPGPPEPGDSRRAQH